MGINTEYFEADAITSWHEARGKRKKKKQNQPNVEVAVRSDTSKPIQQNTYNGLKASKGQPIKKTNVSAVAWITNWLKSKKK